MNLNLVRMLGRWAIDRFQSYTRMFEILYQACAAILRLSFFRPAVALVLIRQIYFTAVQPLTVIIVSSLIIGSLTVHYLLHFLIGLGAYEQIGVFLVRIILLEIAPITCSLIILLRSGTAALAEIALMKINGEMDTLRSLNINLGDYVFMPRLVAFVLAGPCLSVCFSAIALLGGFMILGYWHDITFANYIYRLHHALELKHLAILGSKSALMSMASCLVAMHRGISVDRAFTEIPIRLIQGMMQAVTLLIFVELLFIMF